MSETTIENRIKPEVLAQPVYRVKTPAHRIKLNQNECPWDWPQALKAEVTDRLAETAWNRYPSLIPERLKVQLADRLAVSADQIIIGKGSNEVLQALFRITLQPLDVVCTLSPTFAVYRLLAEQHQARLAASPLSADFQVNPDDLSDRSAEARLTILCSPNSPTGTLVPIETIEQVATNARGLVVVDEAYADFSRVTALPLLERCPDLIITRTFSKAFALAGFRLGYAVMGRELAQEVQKGLLPFNVDLASQVAAEVLLDHTDLVEERITSLIRERDQLIARLNRLPGVTAWPSQANFFLLSTLLSARETFEGLAEQGILVRDVSGYPGCASVVRVTVGTPEENEALVQALERMV
ncbi:MAG: histidinol-phosphate transaminase [Fidelibacterota bacterium]|nr:MAG: histidinol-phosphate transaminase [Candidatus Neomarinimicrobiota bacterium]